MKKACLKVLTLVLCLSFVISFTGCGEKPVEAGDDDGPKATDDNVSAERSGLNGDTIKISMWWDGAPTTELAKATIKAIEEKYNCKIEYVSIPFEGYISKLNASVLSGEPMADIVYIEARTLPALTEADIIIPVDGFFDFSDPKWPSIIKQTGQYAGKQYGFASYSWDGAGIYYNKEMIEKAGIPDPFDLQEKGEWNWDTFIETARATTKDTDGDGAIDQWGLSDQIYYMFNPIVLSNDGDFIKITDDGRAQYMLDTPNAIEALQFVSDLYNKYKVVMPPVEEYEWFDAPRAFTQGKVAMFHGQQWDGVDFKKSFNTEYGFVAFPKGPKAQDHIAPIHTEAKVYVMPKGTRHPKEAAMIFEELFSFDKEVNLSGFRGWMSPGLYSNKYYATVDKIYGRGKLTLYSGFQTYEQTLKNTLVEKLIKGNMPADAFVKEFKEDFQKALDSEFN